MASFLLIFVIFSVGLLIKQYRDESKAKSIPAQLTPKQIIIMLDLGAIKIYEEGIKPNSKDYFTKLVIKRNEEACYVYQDIFGRYYCQWKTGTIK